MSRSQIKSMLTLLYQSRTQIQILQITKWRQNFKQSSYPKDLYIPVGAISIAAGRFIANLRCLKGPKHEIFSFGFFYINQTYMDR